MACAFRCTQYLVAMCLLLALGLFVTAGAVNYWWVNKSSLSHREEGLWKTCRVNLISNSCTTRDDILKFQDNLNKDIVFVGLAAGAFTSLISLILVGVTMCQRYPSKLTVLVEILILFFGVVGGGLSLVWALIKFETDMFTEKGWAFYCLYGADGLIVFAFVFSIILFCVRAPGAYRSTNKDDEIAMLAR